MLLGYSGLRGVIAYRGLALIVSQRASEFPITSELTQSADGLRYSFGRMQTLETHLDTPNAKNVWNHKRLFLKELDRFQEILIRYRDRLNTNASADPFLSDDSGELEIVAQIDRKLEEIRLRASDEDFGRSRTDFDEADVSELAYLTQKLPTILQQRMATFRDEVRVRYRTWMAVTVVCMLATLCILTGLGIYLRRAVIQPFKRLLQGARLVAAGNFEYRIEIGSDDELSELAAAVNNSNASFLRIQQELNHQVMERSKEVIRNEQLASVGFLAAGVAHEINNPLAAIAWSAEALESRLHRIINAIPTADAEEQPSVDIETLRTYLRRIQDEAFRCKGITERLLDFARLGQAEKRSKTDLCQLVCDVIDMIKHVGQYRNRNIQFDSRSPVYANVSPQEMKQVLLNLITNALDSISEQRENGLVQISIVPEAKQVRIVIDDNGCGLTDEVKQHLFEPFFTRRRDGRGTGLGLPITSRIIADHGGRIQVSSDGPGKGARFEVHLPLLNEDIQHELQRTAA